CATPGAVGCRARRSACGDERPDPRLLGPAPRWALAGPRPVRRHALRRRAEARRVADRRAEGEESGVLHDPVPARSRARPRDADPLRERMGAGVACTSAAAMVLPLARAARASELGLVPD